MANNEGLFEEERVGLPPEFFPHLNFVNVGGVQQVQLAQQPATILQNILHGLGYESEWDEDRTVLVITREGNQEQMPQAQVTIEQVADGDEYEFVVRGPDEEVVDLVANTDPNGVMDQLIQNVQALWNALHQPPAPVENVQMEGGRRRRTMRRKARKTRKLKRGGRRLQKTIYRRRR